MDMRIIPLTIALVAVVASIVMSVNLEMDNSKEYGQCEYAVGPDGTTVVGLVDKDTTVCNIDRAISGSKVVAIDDGAFRDSNLRFVSIPDTVKTIGENAFSGCDDILICYGGKPIMTFNGEPYGLPDDVVVKDGAFGNISFMTATIQNSSDNDTLVKSTFTNIPSVVDEMIVTASLNFETDIFGETVIDVGNKSSLSADLDFNTYGLFENIVIELSDDSGDKLCSAVVEGVSVTADHYSFAYLNATYPVLLYSLYLCDGGVDCPTFVFLERKAAYDWNKLPENVQTLPFIKRTQSTEGMNFHEYREGTAQYIRQLYELDNDSTFSFYCVDNYLELILQYFVATNIPDTNWTATMLTDGVGTAGYLNSVFGVNDPDSKYDEMVKEWALVKQAVSEHGYSEEIVKEYAKHAYPDPTSYLSAYPLVLAIEDDNINWITGRLRNGENLVNVPPSFFGKITSAVTQVYTNNLLAALTAEEADQFKQLYHFNGEMFDAARTDGKKIMILLGTSASAEGIDTMSIDSPFYNYVKMTMEFYGTDYYYYYKGHPGYPSEQYKHRQEALDSLRAEGYKIFELDNSIAAEVILFYNPDAYMSGWQTSTFNSVVDETRLCSLYGSAMDGFAQTYKSMIDMFLTPLSGDSYKGIDLDSDRKYWLIQYNSDPTYPAQYDEYQKHEIAIYDSTSDVFTFYKLNDSGVFEVVPR